MAGAAGGTSHRLKLGPAIVRFLSSRLGKPVPAGARLSTTDTGFPKFLIGPLPNERKTNEI